MYWSSLLPHVEQLTMHQICILNQSNEASSNPGQSDHIMFVEIGQEIISTVILPYTDAVIGESMCTYRIDPKFLDRYAWANSADPDQTAPRGAV